MIYMCVSQYTNEELPVGKLWTTEKASGPDVVYINLVSTKLILGSSQVRHFRVNPWISLLGKKKKSLPCYLASLELWM